MRRYLLTIFLFLFLIIVIDRSVNYFLQWVRPVDYKLFIDAKKKIFQSDERYDIVIIGDSHVADAINPRFFEKQNNLSAFNLGIYGSSPFENYYTLLAVLQRIEKKPKALIIGTNSEMFTLPLLPGKYTPLVMDDFVLQWKLNFNSVKPFQSSYVLKTIDEQYLFIALYKKLRGVKYVPTRDVHQTYNGYLESHNQIPDSEWDNFASDTVYHARNAMQIDYFKKTIALAKENGMEVIIVNTPIWFKRLDTEKRSASFREFVKVIDDCRKEYDLPPVFNEDFNLLRSELVKEDFLNDEHLNYSGAKKFSAELADWINQKHPGLN